MRGGRPKTSIETDILDFFNYGRKEYKTKNVHWALSMSVTWGHHAHIIKTGLKFGKSGDKYSDKNC